MQGQRGGVFGQQKIPKLRQMAQNLHRSCQLTKYTYRSLICSHIAYSIQIMRTYLRKRGYNYEDGCGGDAMDASTAEKRPTAISNGLGLNKQMQPKKTRDFYGRWRMRISRNFASTIVMLTCTGRLLTGATVGLLIGGGAYASTIDEATFGRGSQVSKTTATAADVGVGVRINFRRELDLKKKCEIDRAAGGNLRDKNAEESWEIIENLSLYDHQVREEADNPITRFINAISIVKMEKDKSIENNEVVDKNVIEPSELNEVEPIEEEMEDGTDKDIGRLKCVNALIDQGSDVNVMPISIYNRPTNEKSVGTNIRLSLASHSYIYPFGIAEDVLIDIAGYVYPVDFAILDIEEDKNKPFILGTPFLTTAKAEIRFDKGTITLKSGKNKINFFKISKSFCKIEKKTKEYIDPITLINIVSMRIMEWEERIKYLQEKEMGFNQWRSKVFYVEYLTSKKEDNDVIFDEEKPRSS
ncbi:hypothetical protein Tco_0937733 [Tanacetum coccineum]|uniref:Uncharacterized protein n=1 Tax=Tanacetum coccineum TaxID=301880 RepID=A0ABQ5DG26_9ASTR